jgi:hypothetical protein
VPLAGFFRSADELLSETSGTTPAGETTVDPSDHQKVDGALLANVLNTIRTADVLVSLRTPGPELMRIVNALTPRVLVSYRYPAIEATACYPELDFSDHILTRWRRILAGIGVDARDEDMYTALVPPDSHRGFTVVHVGAGSPSRVWPVERWSAVVAHLHAAGHRVLLTGTRSEAARVARVRRTSGLPAGRDRSGAIDILELAHFVAGARLVLCGDTGVSHLATAFRRPAVTLFGPVPPAWWGPPPGNPQHRTLWTGRTGDNYAAHTDPGLLEISAEHVLRTVDELERDQSAMVDGEMD